MSSVSFPSEWGLYLNDYCYCYRSGGMFLYSVVNVYFSAEMLQIVLWILCVFFFLFKNVYKKCKRQGSGCIVFFKKQYTNSVYFGTENEHLSIYVCWLNNFDIDTNFLIWGLSGIYIGCVFLSLKICDLFMKKRCILNLISMIISLDLK